MLPLGTRIATDLVVMGIEWVGFISTTSNLRGAPSYEPWKVGTRSSSRCETLKMTNDNCGSINPLLQASAPDQINSSSSRPLSRCLAVLPCPPPPSVIPKGVVLCHSQHLSMLQPRPAAAGPLASSPLAGPPLVQHNGADCPCGTLTRRVGLGAGLLPHHMSRLHWNVIIST